MKVIQENMKIEHKKWVTEQINVQKRNLYDKEFYEILRKITKYKKMPTIFEYDKHKN